MKYSENIGKIALTFLDMINQLKLYHWRTTSFSRHKASCELLSDITSITDNIIETMQGSKKQRLEIPDNFNTITLNNHTDNSMEELIIYFKEWLIEKFPLYLDENDTDILNLRDELLQVLNKTLYLFIHIFHCFYQFSKHFILTRITTF
jgi:hypothetical protein